VFSKYVETEIAISCHQQKYFKIGGGQHYAQNQEEKPSIAKVVVTDTISILKHSNLRSWNKESEKILLNTATDQVVIFLHVSPNFTW
jgi:hypothetical protein